MGKENVVTKGEVHDLAREFGAKLGEAAAQVRDQDARIQSLAIAFDCLVTVLDLYIGNDDGSMSMISGAVKAELAKRKAAIEAKAKPPVDPCECCGAPGNDGSMPYGIYCDPCGKDITHPTGYSLCFVEDGREHKNAKPADWAPPP